MLQRKGKVKGTCILFNVGGQTGKRFLLTWADCVKVADRAAAELSIEFS